MQDLAILVERAATYARDGRDASAIAVLDEALRSSSLRGPARSFLRYVRALAAADSAGEDECWPLPTIGDNVGDTDIALGVNQLRRWAESRWVTSARVKRLRAACATDWVTGAPQLAVALTAYARKLAHSGALTDAADACRESAALLRDDDLVTAHEGRRADALRLLGALECSNDAFKAASAASAEACRIFRALSLAEGKRHLEAWASASHNLAGARLNEGDIGGAVAAIRAAMAMREELAQAWPMLFRRELAETLAEASRIFSEADLGEEAFVASGRAVALAHELLRAGGDNDPRVLVRALQRHSHSALVAKNWIAGLEAVDAEAALHRELFSDQDVQSVLSLARALHNRATFLTMMERDREAMASLNDSIQLHERLSENVEGAAELLGGSMHLAGSLAARAGDLESSERRFKEALELRVTHRASTERFANANIAQSSIEWANASARLGRTAEVAAATQCALTALGALAKEEPSAFNLTRLAHAFLQLGNAKRRLGDLEAAILAYRSAAALKRRLEEARGNVALAITAARKLIACLKRAGRTDESEAWRQRFSIIDQG